MPSEISAFLQAQAQTQTLQVSNTSSDNESSQPGVFDEFMSEFTLSEEDTTVQDAIAITINNTEDTSQLITFTGNNSFPQSVIDILAGRNETEEFMQDMPEMTDDPTDTFEDSSEKIQADVQSITAKVKAVVSEKTGTLKSELPDDINELVSEILNDESIPDDTKHEIMKAIDELVKGLRDSDLTDENIKSFSDKIPDMNCKPAKKNEVYDSVDEADAEDEDENDDDDVKTDDEEVEVNIEAGTQAGPAVIQPVNPAPVDTVSESESESESTSQPEIPQMNPSSHQDIQTRTVSHERKPATQKSNINPQNESETEDVNHEPQTANFDEYLEHADTENDTSDQNQNHSDNPSGHEEDSPEHEHTNDSTSGITSRTRNDTRRTSNTTSRTQNERTETNSHRTESRSTFQSFFEGVLNSRRNASRTSPVPLDLRAASYSFNQSQTLRDGMINVVRFIRADGVQKANVVIDPPALGRISVELTSTSSGVEASIKVASEQIRQLVQDQLSELRMNLSQQGVQVAEFTVDVQQDNSGNGNHQGSQYGSEQRAFAINEADDETEEFRIDLEEGLLYWVA